MRPTTNSLVASMFAYVSFLLLPGGRLGLRQIPMATVGGLWESTLKYEKGATFWAPSADSCWHNGGDVSSLKLASKGRGRGVHR
jgi:hypothetical protein